MLWLDSRSVLDTNDEFDIFRQQKSDCNKQESDLFLTRLTTKLQTRTNKKTEGEK